MEVDLNPFLSKPNQDCPFDSPIPNCNKKQAWILGVDEAGRGPVMGAMVYAAAYYPANESDKLAKLGFADSKTLTEVKREDIFGKIGVKSYSLLGWSATAISPVTISNSMFKRSKYNLNQLSHDTTIALIHRVINKGINVQKVFIDAVGPVDKYESKLKAIFPSITIKVANKADSTYPIVSAASVCAKVIRDRIIKNWKFIEDVTVNGMFGSGYPADPVTKAFLTKNFDPLFGFPNIVRFSWSTISKIIEDKGIDCEWEDNEDEKKNTQPIKQFFKRKADDDSSSQMSKRSNIFFNDRNLTKINTKLF